MKKVFLCLMALTFCRCLYAASVNKVNVTTAATQILPASTNRVGWCIHNTSTGTVWIGFNSSISTTTAMPILPSEKIFSDGTHVYKNGIWGILDASQSSSDIRYLEWGLNDSQ